MLCLASDWIDRQMKLKQFLMLFFYLFFCLYIQWASTFSSLPDGSPQRFGLPLRSPVLATPFRRELPSSVLRAGALREQYVCVCPSLGILYSSWTVNICSLAVYQALTCTHLQETGIWRMVLLRKRTCRSTINKLLFSLPPLASLSHSLSHSRSHTHSQML